MESTVVPNWIQIAIVCALFAAHGRLLMGAHQG